MANEVTVVEQAEVLVAPTPTPNYNKNVGEKVIKISIKCKRVKNSEGDFNSVKGLKHLEVIVDGVSEGKKNRWLDMHFLKTAFKGVPAECEVHTREDLTTGFLYVKAKFIQSPRKYEVVEETDKDGNVVYNEDGTAKLKYPEIWIKGGIVGFEPYVSDQDEFDYHETVKDAEYTVNNETGEIIDEPSDEDEVNLK